MHAIHMRLRAVLAAVSMIGLLAVARAGPRGDPRQGAAGQLLRPQRLSRRVRRRRAHDSGQDRRRHLPCLDQAGRQQPAHQGAAAVRRARAVARLPGSLRQLLPGAGIQYYYYDQLGTGHSDHPKDIKLWTLPRAVEEVEQVRKALGLNKHNFYLYGHSWGGVLALQYALKYQDHLKGLIISNMMASGPAYNAYAHKVLMPRMDPKALAEILKLEKEGKTDDPQYMKLLMAHYYTKHVLRMPPGQWPEPVTRALDHVNEAMYVRMQGPSEMGLGGRLTHWDVSRQLKDIRVPTLTIGARYGTMDPKYMHWMAGQVQHGRYLYCPHGSHLAMYDDQAIYMAGLIRLHRGRRRRPLPGTHGLSTPAARSRGASLQVVQHRPAPRRGRRRTSPVPAAGCGTPPAGAGRRTARSDSRRSTARTGCPPACRAACRESGWRSTGRCSRRRSRLGSTCSPAQVPSARSASYTASVSGRLPCHSAKLSAAVSTSMPRPSSA